ncbi:LysR family substrate-binding domain-containing protein [Hoyosella subflava]|uniref:LysR-family transcription regulator n=1 Tax=Hoyosella subflava (strain DSM 45089 / JCM 17490 / NBRC 109087 / DQS3-9A1) TaxID=443218 RepID=F6ERM0_HOYSD|nr:LysR family substrate-binding domain-containing protein [Hoyosella subflava]AEF38540.1 LysR-family transcription regulator [Hoyosella subflava DQS3-9A1]
MTDPKEFWLGYVPGATPAKWAQRWSERVTDVPLQLVQVSVSDQCAALVQRRVDAALVRLPPQRAEEWDLLSVVPLYDEMPVVVVPRGHFLCAGEEVTCADLADEAVWHPLDDMFAWECVGGVPGVPQLHRPATSSEAVDLVATGTGVTVVPMSVARLHHDPELVLRPLAAGPRSHVGIAWLAERSTDTDALLDEMVGIVKGRRANSSRGLRGQTSAMQKPAPKPTAKTPGRGKSRQPPARRKQPRKPGR